MKPKYFIFKFIFLVVLSIGLMNCGKPASDISDIKNIKANVYSCEYPLSSVNNRSHTIAKRLNHDFHQRGVGLDDERYHKQYNKELSTTDPRFDWEVYKQFHPTDAVIQDKDNKKKYWIYSDNVDEFVFSTQSHVNK